jgi:phosphoglycolate phosphatase
MSDYLPGTRIEVINPALARGDVRSALFDFDGTLSLIRQGWQSVMIPLMVEVLRETPQHEDEAALEAAVVEYVTRSTGIQTIFQMMELVEMVRARGGVPRTAQEYKAEYLRRLWQHIRERVEGLKSGRLAADDLLVPGAREVLEGLRRRGVTCYLASGTDRPYVVDEAAALGLTPFFGSHIYGALDDIHAYSKRQVIQRILRENHLQGPNLVTFGDGFVEIEDTKAVGGIAVGVASDEVARQGVDEWKRGRLIQAGADLIVPDFREHEALLGYLCEVD